MTNETLETESLKTLADKIVKCATAADQKTIEAAKMIRAARARVENGEAGEITWSEWASKNIKLSGSRLRELQRIADADDPNAELKQIRKKNKARQARHREKNKSAPLPNGGSTAKMTTQMEHDRKRLIEWARKAPLDHVGKVLTFIDELSLLDEPTNPDQYPEPATAM